MDILKKYDIEKDKLHFEYDEKLCSLSLFKEEKQIPIKKLNRKSYYILVEENLKMINNIYKERLIKRNAM